MPMNSFNPELDRMEIDPITGLPKSAAMPGAESPMASPSVDPMAVPSPAPAPAPMNPAVRDYIAKKFNLGEYTDENRKKLAEESKVGIGDKLAAMAAAVGAGFQGRDSGAAGTAVLRRADENRAQKLNEFERGRANEIQKYQLDKEVTNDAQVAEKMAREKDPTSEESKMAQQLATRMGFQGDSSKITAEQFRGYSPVLSKMYEIEQKKLDRAEARDERRFQSGIKMNEKMQGLKTPYGIANTEDDAKKLKEAHESKQNFDSKIQEMIDLRKEYGGEAFNREAVSRGKQLSKDLLLEYKNMAKLGVLSKSDEDIINAIIPADPLEFSISKVAGQDPILSNLEKFKSDSDKDFATRVQTRTRQGISDYESGKTPAMRDNKKPAGKVKVSNGKETLMIDAADLKDAEADGFSRVQ